MKTYVINLDERTDRFAWVSRDLDALGLQWERVSGVKIPPSDFSSNTSKMRAFARLGGVLPSLGQVGCYCSHRKIWQMMLDQNISQALILEDDAVPENWDVAVTQVDIAQHHLDMLRLEFHSFYGIETPPTASKLLGRDISLAATWGSAAYIITAQGARKCLSAGPFWFVMDDYNIWSSVYQLRTALLMPPMFRHRDVVDTNIISPYVNKGFRTKLAQVVARQLDPLFVRRERQRISLLLSSLGNPAGENRDNV